MPPPGPRPQTATERELVVATTTLEFLLSSLNELVDGIVLPTPTVLARVFAGASVRARVTAHGVLHLATYAVPLGVEALQLARSIWELLLSLEYISSADAAQREERAIRYLSHAIATRNKVVHAVGLVIEDGQLAQNEAFVRNSLRDHLVAQGMTQPEAGPEARKRIEEWSAKTYWSGMGLWKLIQQISRAGIDRKAEYRWVYPFLSQYAHAGSSSILPFGDQGTVLAAYDETGARPACQWTAEWVIELYLLVNDVFHLHWEQRLTDLLDGFKEQWNRHQAAPGATGEPQ